MALNFNCADAVFPLDNLNNYDVFEDLLSAISASCDQLNLLKTKGHKEEIKVMSLKIRFLMMDVSALQSKLEAESELIQESFS